MSFAYSFLIAFIFSFVNPADVPYSELETAFSTGNATAISNMGKRKCSFPSWIKKQLTANLKQHLF